MYAHVVNNTIDATSTFLPNAARRLDTQEWVFFAFATAAERQACGWFDVVAVARPADTVDNRWSDSVQLVSGVPTQVWTAVPKTAQEKADETAAATRSTNLQALTDLATLVAKMNELETFFADTDVVAAQNQANNTALPTQTQNRFNKALITEMRRLKNMEVRLVRALVSRYQPSLLDVANDV